MDQRLCPFSGEASLLRARLIGSEVEIEHILPFSRSLGRRMQQQGPGSPQRRQPGKGQPNALRGLGHERSRDVTKQVLARAEVPCQPKKAWRFQPDAMEKFEASGRTSLAGS